MPRRSRPRWKRWPTRTAHRRRHALAVQDQPAFAHFHRVPGQADHPLDVILVAARRSDDHHVAPLDPAPIRPEWILSGTPTARARTLARTADDDFSTTVWDCTAGSFRWQFRSDESVHILEGEVIVETGDGRTRTLRPGDVALFPRGMASVWTVPRYVKKLAQHRSHPPGLMARTAARVRSLF